MENLHHMGQTVLDNLQLNPDEILQIDSSNGAKETRGSFRKRSIKVAKHMTKLGLKKHDIVTICSFNHNDTCLPLAAAFYNGIVISVLDIGMAKVEYENLLRQFQPKMIFTEVEKAQILLEVSKSLGFETTIVTYGDDSRFLCLKEFYDNDYTTEDFQVADIDPSETTAYIMSSSGSTGLPKGVIHTHKNTVLQMKAIMGAFSHHTLVQFSSMFWVSGIVMSVINLMSVAIKINAKSFTPETFCNVIEKYKGTFCVFPSTTMRMLLKHPGIEKADLSSIKRIMLSGASVDFEDIKQLQKYLPNGKVVNSFGMTEIGGPVTYTLQDEPLRVGSCGRVLPHIEAKVIERVTKEKLPPNQVGELCIRSPYIMKGYYKNPEATKEVMNDEGWIMTGDLAKFDNDGYLYVMDRIKDMFKVRGITIAPVTLESLINTYPGVRECVIVGFDDKDQGSLPVACIVKEKGSMICEEDIHKFVEKNLTAAYKLSGGVMFVDSIEMTPSGKNSRSKMKELAKAKFGK